MQKDFFALDGTPTPRALSGQTFGENIIALVCVHPWFGELNHFTGLDTGILQTLNISGTGKVAALVAVPDFRHMCWLLVHPPRIEMLREKQKLGSRLIG